MKVVIVNHNGFWNGFGFTEKNYQSAVVFESEKDAAETLEVLTWEWNGGAETLDYDCFLKLYSDPDDKK